MEFYFQCGQSLRRADVLPEAGEELAADESFRCRGTQQRRKGRLVAALHRLDQRGGHHGGARISGARCTLLSERASLEGEIAVRAMRRIGDQDEMRDVL